MVQAPDTSRGSATTAANVLCPPWPEILKTTWDAMPAILLSVLLIIGMSTSFAWVLAIVGGSNSGGHGLHQGDTDMNQDMETF
jgi:hypothetical protein